MRQDGQKRISIESAVRDHEEVRRDGPLRLKPYLSIRELAELTPWTDQAIRTMISRGVLREGVHFFYVGRRPVFKWEAVVAFIEHREVETQGAIPLRRGGFLGGSSEA